MEQQVLLARKEHDLTKMKYDAFKKRIAQMLNEAHPDLDIQPRNGSKLFSALEKDLLGTMQLCKQITLQTAEISQLRAKLQIS